MRRRTPRTLICCWGLCSFLLWASTAGAQESGWQLDGAARVAEKYDNNLDLTALESPQEKSADAVTELGGRVQGSYTGSAWDLNLGGRLRGDMPNSTPSRTRLYVASDVYIAWQFATNHSLSFQSQGDCFAQFDDGALNVCRVDNAIAWRWAIGERLVLRLGIEDHEALYFGDADLDYSINGLFLEVRVPWSYRFSVWARADALSYHQFFKGQTEAEEEADEGDRASLELGFDWVPTSGLTIVGLVQGKVDESNNPRRQVGGPDFPDNTLDTDAQFNFRKVRATLLTSWRIHPKWRLGAFGEVLRIAFFDVPDPIDAEPARVDVRWLLSGWLSYALTDQDHVQLQYLVRQNHSSEPGLDFDNQIISLGIERRW